MATIQIRNVPDDVAKAFKIRAARSGQSLQEYMLSYVTAGAAKPTVAELMATLNQRSLERQRAGTAADLDPEITLRGIDESWED